MIRVCLFRGNDNAYGYDVTGWEDKPSEFECDNLLCEDLVNRVNEGDILIYFDTNENAEEWCENHDYKYELVKPEEEEEEEELYENV